MAERALIKTFAKINLYLDVICRRPDDYHNIETIFQTIDLCDTLDIELAPFGIDVTCNHPAVPPDETNLVARAFIALKEATDYTGGIRIAIEKNIPPGSGLGGGSSNAAATLAALNQMLGCGLPDRRLREMASRLGADVPFFLSGGRAAAWGIGDKIMPMPASQESWLVTAVPRDLTVSTPEAYARLHAPACNEYNPESFTECTKGLMSRAKTLGKRRPMHEIRGIESMLHNSLEDSVFSRHPEILRLKEAAIEAGARCALMTGSGSAVYGLAISEKDARSIASKLGDLADCDCFAVKTTSHGMQDLDLP